MKQKYEELITEGTKLFKEGKSKKAAKYFEEAFEYRVNPNDVMTLGFIYLELKNYARAEDLFNAVLEIERNARGLYGLGLVKDNLNKKTEAIALYEEAIALEDTEPLIYFDCAYVYDELGEFDKAIAYYQKAIALNKDYFWAHLNLGSIYEKLGKDYLALEAFQKAYKIDDQMPMIAYNLGVVHAKLKNDDLALKYYLKELERKTPYKMIYYNLGLLYKDAFKDYRKAKIAYLEGLKQDKDNFLIWYNLGCLYAIMKEYDNAYECFLYLYFKNREIFNYSLIDEELIEFRQSSQYKKIMGINP